MLNTHIDVGCVIRVFSFCWITGGYKIKLTLEGALSTVGIKSPPFRNSVSCLHATTSDESNVLITKGW